MPGRFPFTKLEKYPHLGPHDVKVWEHFLKLFPDYFASVDYDVWVGEGAKQPEEIEQNEYTKNFEDLTKFRIDVVGYAKDGTIYCIELRPHAGLSAFGSTLGCTKLLAKMYPNTPVLPMIITDIAQSDLTEICFDYGVELVELSYT